MTRVHSVSGRSITEIKVSEVTRRNIRTRARSVYKTQIVIRYFGVLTALIIRLGRRFCILDHSDAALVLERGQLDHKRLIRAWSRNVYSS